MITDAMINNRKFKIIIEYIRHNTLKKLIKVYTISKNTGLYTFLNNIKLFKSISSVLNDWKQWCYWKIIMFKYINLQKWKEQF